VDLKAVERGRGEEERRSEGVRALGRRGLRTRAHA
jgi:hypothetical protein